MKVIVMSRESLMQASKTPFPEGTAVISITDSEAEDVVLVNHPDKILRLKFDDVSEEIFEELLGRKPNTREMHQIASKLTSIYCAKKKLLGKLTARDFRSCHAVCIVLFAKICEIHCIRSIQ